MKGVVKPTETALLHSAMTTLRWAEGRYRERIMSLDRGVALPAIKGYRSALRAAERNLAKVMSNLGKEAL